MRELELIAELPELLRHADPRVVRWLGDDAAVTRGGPYVVTSVDTMVDGVHFRTGELSPGEIGHRALAGALSDLAAMGLGADAGPQAFLALGLPPGSAEEDVRELLAGAATLARDCGVTIAGGDVTSCPVLTVSFTVIGSASDPGELIQRTGARPGDIVGITGSLGGAGGGLAVVEGRLDGLSVDDLASLRERYARPLPRLAAGRALALAGATAMIDLSDGLATDAGHLAQASGVELTLSLAALPLTPGLSTAAAVLGLDPREWAATAGEDYELCVCAAPAARQTLEAALASAAPSVPITWIGNVSARRDGRGAGVRFSDGSRPLTGYEHSL
jgi:thiamine-monophosphate kinase